jgi:hypothetical protein
MNKLARLVLPVLLCSACGTKASTPVAQVDAAADVPTTDLAADVSATVQVPTPAERGLTWTRNVVHIHSAFSHDACDNWITDHDGDVNQTCLQQLRVGLCESGLDVAFMTDHPGRMKDHTFDELLFVHPELGDKPVGEPGKHHANVVHCAKTATMPEHDLVVTVGYEGTHDLAVGLHGHFDADLEGRSFADAATTLADAKLTVDAIHKAGGLSLNAHSEEDDISVQRLVDLGIDGMEVYNTHANFKTIVGLSAKGATGNIGRVVLLERFLGDPAQSPDPDLALLVMLDIQPEAAFLKWQAVNAQRRVTGLIGNDVHQNVVLPQICTPVEGSICEGLQDDYPHLAKSLENGGPLMLADGKRIDDYTRLLRWISNHTLLPKDTPADQRAEVTKQALRDGHTWAVFDALGDPQGLDFTSQDAKTKQWVEMGGTVAVGSKLYLTLPTVTPTPWAHWTAADVAAEKPVVSAKLWRIVPGQDKAELVMTATGEAGQRVMVQPDLPGRYHVELRVAPKHLRKLLKGLKPVGDGAPEFADVDLRWAVGNPIDIK